MDLGGQNITCPALDPPRPDRITPTPTCGYLSKAPPYLDPRTARAQHPHPSDTTRRRTRGRKELVFSTMKACRSDSIGAGIGPGGARRDTQKIDRKRRCGHKGADAFQTTSGFGGNSRAFGEEKSRTQPDAVSSRTRTISSTRDRGESKTDITHVSLA